MTSGVTDQDWTAEDQARFDALATGHDDPGVGDGESGDEGGERGAPLTVQGKPLEEAVADADPSADDDDDGDAEGNRPGFVPHRRLHKAREQKKAAEEQAKAAEARAQQAEINAARAMERMNTLLQVFKGQQQPQQGQTQEPAAPPVRPRAEEDVFKTADYAVEQTESLAQRVERIEKAEQAQKELGQMADWARRHEEAFAKERPDYPAALSHLKQARARELAIQGYNRAQIEQQITADEVHIIRVAAHRQMSPAALAYEIAGTRGYSPKAPEPPQEAPAERITRTAEAQQRSRTLSGTGGSPAGATNITAETVLRMSEDEFAAFAAKYPKKMEELLRV